MPRTLNAQDRILSTAAPVLAHPYPSGRRGLGSRSVHSPNGSVAIERDRLHRRYEARTLRSGALNRRLVSYQGNKQEPGLRWMKFKEAFSKSLVEHLIYETNASRVLDPFSGIGTTALTSATNGATAIGIELMPVGILAARAISYASNDVYLNDFVQAAGGLLHRVASPVGADSEHRFKHVRITEGAFPEKTEEDIAKAREFLSSVDTPQLRVLLEFACVSVLEEIGYTRKDGQYLRWDYRSGRDLKSRVDKGPVLDLKDALDLKLEMMISDTKALQSEHSGGSAEFLQGSCLEQLSKLNDSAFDLVVTSPPYANRYDYTRTYALELAWMGLDQSGFSRLRQQMISATVENHSKYDGLDRVLGSRNTWQRATHQSGSHAALNEVLDSLRKHRSDLSNPNVIRLLEGYFLEMAYVVAELARVVQPGGTVVMVNDNVQYHGEHVPVDQILSDFAEGSGLVCERILTLPRGKGNSSQQMGRFGRNEIRKCVYIWTKPHE